MPAFYRQLPLAIGLVVDQFDFCRGKHIIRFAQDDSVERRKCHSERSEEPAFLQPDQLPSILHRGLPAERLIYSPIARMAIEPISRTRVAIRIILVLLIILLIGVWVFSLQHKALDVRIATVQRGALTASSSTNGIVEPVQEFEAHAPVATVVKQVLVKEGDRVPKGKLMLAL